MSERLDQGARAPWWQWRRDPADSSTMLAIMNWGARSLGYIWIGLLALVLLPPAKVAGAVVQATGYALVGLGFAALAVIDLRPAAGKYRARWQPVLLGLVAVAAGFASGTGSGGSALIIFAFVAALMASADTSFTASIAVTAAGILAIEVTGSHPARAKASCWAFPRW